MAFGGGDANLNRYVGSQVTTYTDADGLRGTGHHLVPWSIFNGNVAETVQRFFDSDVARICNEFYKHGAQTQNGV
jgi:hypothetical protein